MREETFRWLEGGGTLITVNRRLARVFTREFHALQSGAGRTLWRRPDILPLDAFLDREWSNAVWRGANEGLALLTPWQEQLVWEQVIRDSPAGAGLLRIPETARRAREAWQLIRAYRLPVDGRYEASDDWSAFAAWVREFDSRCRDKSWLDRARFGDFIARRVENQETFRLSPGFEERTPQQAELFRTLGDPPSIDSQRFDADVVRYRFDDADAEIRAAAHWSCRLLEQDQRAQIGVIVPGLESLRSKIDRIFCEVLDPAGALENTERAFHLALGPPLTSYPPAHAALLALEFAGEQALPLTSAGVLLRSPFLSGAQPEWTARGQLDARLRRRGGWRIGVASLAAESVGCPLLERALSRFQKSIAKLPREQRPSEWSRAFSELLDALGWPGDRALSSAEFQLVEAWRGALSDLAALDLVAGPMSHDAALSRLRDIAAATPFQFANEGAPVQIMGPLESTGLTFDHLWIMGLHDEALPLPASPNPFVPISLQREHKLPRSSADGELAFARALLDRTLAISPHVTLSYPASDGDHALGPSPLVAGDWQTMPAPPADAWIAHMRATLTFEELATDPAPPLIAETPQRGGTALFKDMAACPFRAFAKHRLGAKPLDEATLGPNYKDRGNSVHRAMHFIWRELASHTRLLEIAPGELRDLIARAAAQAVDRFTSEIGQQLERTRLQKLLWQWLEIEKTRAPFTVWKVEEEREVNIGGLQVKIRADRIDQQDSGGDVVLDYKTGEIKPSVWETDRPDEPQLPLYCTTSDRPAAAAAFAVIRTGELEFRGLSDDGPSLPGLRRMSMDRALAFPEQIREWRRVLEGLAGDFRAGRAAVDPKPNACEHCGLWSLCRIREFEHDR